VKPLDATTRKDKDDSEADEEGPTPSPTVPLLHLHLCTRKARRSIGKGSASKRRMMKAQSIAAEENLAKKEAEIATREVDIRLWLNKLTSSSLVSLHIFVDLYFLQPNLFLCCSDSPCTHTAEKIRDSLVMNAG
jgi:hypothetical protein